MAILLGGLLRIFFWLPNAEPNVGGYRIYLGRGSQMYTVPGSPFDMGLGQIEGSLKTGSIMLPDYGTYFAAAVAYNTSAQEGPLTAELSFTAAPYRPVIGSMVG